MNRKILLVGSVFVSVFAALMIYALSQDPNAVLSQLVNKPAPAIAAEIAQGGQFNSDSVFKNNKWTIINFWSTSCVVCRYEAPELERFYRTTTETSSSEFQFVSINIQDDTQSILQYTKEQQLSFPVVMDRSGKVSLDYGVTGTPETFFVDESGVVRHRVAGDLNGELIVRFVDVLKQNRQLSPEESMKRFLDLKKKS